MYSRLFRFVFIVVAALPLMAFRLPVASETREKMLYDVRGAFVTARPEVPKGLVIATDMLLDVQIRSTVRSIVLPRTIISVRIEETRHQAMLIGSRHEAKVTVQAVSVSSGETVARGTFNISLFLLDAAGADKGLAEKISDRIASEFHLDGQGRSTLATAMFERNGP